MNNAHIEQLCLAIAGVMQLRGKCALKQDEANFRRQDERVKKLIEELKEVCRGSEALHRE